MSLFKRNQDEVAGVVLCLPRIDEPILKRVRKESKSNLTERLRLIAKSSSQSFSEFAQTGSKTGKVRRPQY
ncbi:MAG: hypothetical protein IPO15_01550 [Anaerolineae bacterium]|uniref:hypothetical protein n=1 Tax=Candidatus Amarolinea dominans TaxID=3140696 RepID=UPI00313648C8|nr:hypothetical protein [Anaerolineae bacterium]